MSCRPHAFLLLAMAAAACADDRPQQAPAGPLSPSESAGKFNVMTGLAIDQLLSEPVVAQPVFLNFDERGRMWVVQYRQYPEPAGLTRVSRDSFWRTVWDKVPPPPPHHFKGADRITIHEDADGDGVFEGTKFFVDGLNIATAVERGRGGVWVLNPPYLLFYPDKNNDDVPDGDPVVHLSGFGLEDTHSVCNSLRWGPDGWLYAAQGSTVSAAVIRPGIDREPIARTLGQQIWRYHPETRRFETFSEGGGNAFGCEIDAAGRIFSGHNGGDTRGFHYDQGAYLQKGFDKHGPLSNPHAFGYFGAMAHHAAPRFTHNFIVYEGGALPESYHGRLFGAEPLQGRIVLSEMTGDATTFKTKDLGYAVVADDRWFRPVDIKAGPDGGIYLCDWYDQQVSHVGNSEGKFDAKTGRIYRLRSAQRNPGRPPFDFSKLKTPELLVALQSPNKWDRQTAQRILADRKDAAAIPTLVRQLHESRGQMALECLWALHGSGGLAEPEILTALEHPTPEVRLWAVRMACDSASGISSVVAEKIAALCQSESDANVRKQCAASARRLPVAQALPIIKPILKRDADARDPRIPLMLWWAIEAFCTASRTEVIAFFSDTELWRQPLVMQHILERLARRFCQSGTRADLLACGQLFDLSPTPDHSKILLRGVAEAFKGRTMAGLPLELIKSMRRHGGASPALAVRMGEPEAISTALKRVGEPAVPATERLEFLQVLGEVRVDGAVPILLHVVEKEPDDSLRRSALTALAIHDAAEIGTRITALYPSLRGETLAAAQSLLSTRPAWAKCFADAAGAGKIAPDTVPLTVVRRLKQLPDDSLRASLEKVWPNSGVATTAAMTATIDRISGVLQKGRGDPYKGRAHFLTLCSSCHKFFGQGGAIGPELTAFDRQDTARLLLNIINPGAEIREGYENVIVETADGRTLGGFLADEDNQTLVLRSFDGQTTAIQRANIKSMRSAGASLMPEGLISGFTDEQLRDFFAYLRMSQPLVVPAK